jgi:hypothetical protein
LWSKASDLPRFSPFVAQPATETAKVVTIPVEAACYVKRAAPGECQDLFQELLIFDSQPINASACGTAGPVV